MATGVDVSTGAVISADDDNDVGAAVPPSLTNDKDAYVGASVAFKKACALAHLRTVPVNMPQPPRSCHHAAAVALCAAAAFHAAATAADTAAAATPPPSSHRSWAVALPPALLTLPLPPRCRRQASANVLLAHCHHRQRRTVSLPPPPLTLPLPSRRRQAAANVALSEIASCASCASMAL